MKKIKRSYVEKIYRGLLFSDSAVSEVTERDPMKIENDGLMQGFRFYDKEFVKDGKNEFAGKRTNVSRWIFYGERLTLDDVLAKYGNYEVVIKNMKINGYKYVCHTQAGTFLPMEEGDMTFDEYVAKKGKDKENKAKEMFDKLREHLGEDVSFTGWWYGVKQEETGELKDVEDFFNVSIGSYGIPFVGYGSAISKIVSKDGEVLYSNPNIEKNYDRRDEHKIDASRRLIFGDEIVDKEIAEREKAKKEFEDWKDKMTEAAKKDKYSLMREGLALVKPEVADEWLQFVDNNCNDGYSAQVVRAAISMMKKLNEGMSFEDAEQKVYNEELGLTGFLATSTASTLAHFAKQGEEYRNYWNKKFGVDDNGKGTVNPTVLAFKKK